MANQTLESLYRLLNQKVDKWGNKFSCGKDKRFSTLYPKITLTTGVVVHLGEIFISEVKGKNRPVYRKRQKEQHIMTIMHKWGFSYDLLQELPDDTFLIVQTEKNKFGIELSMVKNYALKKENIEIRKYADYELQAFIPLEFFEVKPAEEQVSA
jgi:hypothetical protein